jgi:hypothetical protein
VTGLLQTAIGRLFRRGNNDPFVADQNQQNFEKVACLYEQIEGCARRCDSVLLNTILLSVRTKALESQLQSEID